MDSQSAAIPLDKRGKNRRVLEGCMADAERRKRDAGKRKDAGLGGGGKRGRRDRRRETMEGSMERKEKEGKREDGGAV